MRERKKKSNELVWIVEGGGGGPGADGHGLRATGGSLSADHQSSSRTHLPAHPPTGASFNKHDKSMGFMADTGPGTTTSTSVVKFCIWTQAREACLPGREQPAAGPGILTTASVGARRSLEKVALASLSCRGCRSCWSSCCSVCRRARRAAGAAAAATCALGATAVDTAQSQRETLMIYLYVDIYLLDECETYCSVNILMIILTRTKTSDI